MFFASSAASYAAQRDEFDNLRFEVRQGDTADIDTPGNAGTERSEIDHIGSLDQARIINISYLQMVQAGDRLDDGAIFAFGQLHHVGDAGDVSVTPPFMMRPGERTTVRVSYYGGKPMIANPPSLVTFAGASPSRNVWTAYRWRFKIDPTGLSGGFLQVFRNGSLIVDYSGPFGFSNQKGPSPQFGVYRRSTAETVAVYYSGISISYET